MAMSMLSLVATTMIVRRKGVEVRLTVPLCMAEGMGKGRVLAYDGARRSLSGPSVLCTFMGRKAQAH